MIFSKNSQENKLKKTAPLSDYEDSPLIELDNSKSKDKKSNKIVDREIGSIRSNFTRTKKFLKNSSILDKDMGTLRSNFLKVKIFFKNIFFYIRSFFTKKKMNEVKEIFSYKKTLNEQSRSNLSISSNPEIEKNKSKH